MNLKEEKRINERFERIEALILALATESTARFAEHEVWFKRFETNLAETLSASNARFVRIEANLEQVAAGQAKHDTAMDRLTVTTALLDRAESQHEKWRADYEMRQAESEKRLDRIERACDFITSSQASTWEALRHLVDAFDAHRKNPYGHGGKPAGE